MLLPLRTGSQMKYPKAVRAWKHNGHAKCWEEVTQKCKYIRSSESHSNCYRITLHLRALKNKTEPPALGVRPAREAGGCRITKESSRCMTSLSRWLMKKKPERKNIREVSWIYFEWLVHLKCQRLSYAAACVCNLVRG